MVSEGNGGLVTANLLTTIMALACYARLQYCASHVPEQVGTVRHALRLQAVAIALSLVAESSFAILSRPMTYDACAVFHLAYLGIAAFVWILYAVLPMLSLISFAAPIMVAIVGCVMGLVQPLPLATRIDVTIFMEWVFKMRLILVLAFSIVLCLGMVFVPPATG